MRLIEKLPEMLAGEELIQEMSLHPAYEEELCRNGSDAQRLMKLSDLYNIYLPSGMSTEIYSKLYGKNYTAINRKADSSQNSQQRRNLWTENDEKGGTENEENNF